MPLPGIEASSTIFSTSEDGRLSTTYHPRSSSTSAVADRPAPDIRDEDDLRHWAERLVDVELAPEVEQARNGRRLAVLRR